MIGGSRPPSGRPGRSRTRRPTPPDPRRAACHGRSVRRRRHGTPRCRACRRARRLRAGGARTRSRPRRPPPGPQARPVCEPDVPPLHRTESVLNVSEQRPTVASARREGERRPWVTSGRRACGLRRGQVTAASSLAHGHKDAATAVADTQPTRHAKPRVSSGSAPDRPWCCTGGDERCLHADPGRPVHVRAVDRRQPGPGSVRARGPAAARPGRIGAADSPTSAPTASTSTTTTSCPPGSSPRSARRS